jgi:uridine kinase
VERSVRPIDALLVAFGGAARPESPALVAIDGLGGSGKSTLARAIAAASDGVAVVQMDDFYRPPSDRPAARPGELGADIDWRRFRDQVVQPLREGGRARYQRRDWDTGRLAEWHEVAGDIVVAEGVYSSRTELSALYDFRIWVECPYDIRLARGIERDGEAARERWVSEWMPAEERYADLDGPRERADLVVDGSGTVRHDPRIEFVQIGRPAP